MATTYIIQPGRILQRMEVSPEGTHTSGDASIPITSVSASITTTINTTAPFIGVLDENNHLWRLQNLDVTYSASSITLNLTDIYRSRKMITTEASILVALPGSTLKAYKRYPESDSVFGYAWMNADSHDVLFTNTQVASVGMNYYTSPELTSVTGTVSSIYYPTKAEYPGGWRALVAALSSEELPIDLDFTVVSQPV